MISAPFTDADECTENTDGCEQMCTDTDGSFECSCRAGFRLGSNRMSCDGECATKGCLQVHASSIMHNNALTIVYRYAPISSSMLLLHNI